MAKLQLEPLPRAPVNAGVPDVSKLERLLRVSVAIQLLALGPEHSSGAEMYRNTAVSAVLRDSHVASMRSLVRSLMEQNFPAYEQLVNGAPCMGVDYS